MTVRAFVLRSLPAMAACALLTGAGARAQMPERQLRVMFTEDMFTDVRVTDALAAIKVWTNDLSGRTGAGEQVSNEVASSLEAVAQALIGQRADIVALRTPDYLHLRKRTGLRPFVMAKSGALAETRGVLIVGPQSRAQAFDDLKGLGLTVVGTPAGGTARLWLETLVMKRGFATLEAFFGDVRTVSKASQAVLPVFFGQSAAALVDDGSLKTIGELNPQVARQVRTLAASVPLLAAVICTRGDFPEDRREYLIGAIRAMTDDPRGQQTMALFKSSGMVAFEPSTMTAVEALVAEHDSLTASLARRAQVPVAPATPTRRGSARP
jgi:ABC-type phosphate/phosphonate transport system substrate-binding protein